MAVGIPPINHLVYQWSLQKKYLNLQGKSEQGLTNPASVLSGRASHQTTSSMQLLHAELSCRQDRLGSSTDIKSISFAPEIVLKHIPS